ncbi:hypothetical protein DMB66_58665 [Actinoplanes sp. ATCC 53533]|nr:hypothetical protein DMB66_58665 [Actinoplanes sp. ATCC 53533]
MADMKGTLVSAYGREAPVAQALPSDLRSPGAFGFVLYVIASLGDEWLNRFHWFLVPSSIALSPTVIVVDLFECATIPVTGNSIPPGPEQPWIEPSLRLAAVVAVHALYQVGCLSQVVLLEMAPVSHSFALDLGPQVQAWRCSIRNFASRMCVPLTLEMSIRNNDRTM